MSLKWYNISIILISGGINMAQFKIITILIGLVLVTVFAVQNSANVIIKFLIYHFTVSQALIIILSVAV